jgi:hypothetical protein
MPRKDNNFSIIQGSSPQAFSQVGALLSRPDLWTEWFAGRPERADLFKAAFSCVVRISSHTGWPEEVALEHLGCDTKTEEELSDLTETRLRNCIDYMGWAESLLANLDLAIDKRLTVHGAAKFFVAAERDLSIVREAMDAGDFSPTEYLRLGEIARAWEVALASLSGPEGDRVREIHDKNPFFDASTPHMSPMRLEMLGRADAAELLGSRVKDLMDEHVSLCHVCESSKRRTAAQLADDLLVGAR